MQKLNIPIIIGTTRPGRQSIHAAKLILEVANTIDRVNAFLVDPLDFNLPFDGNDEEVKDPKYTKITAEADAFYIVVPEYNHSFPGSLKRLLDSELANYIHKPVAFAGVSNGSWGGVRAIEALITAVRESGLVPTFSDMQFPRIQDLFDAEGKLLNENYRKYINTAFEELIWMANTLKYGRENIKSKYHNK